MSVPEAGANRRSGWQRCSGCASRCWRDGSGALSRRPSGTGSGWLGCAGARWPGETGSATGNGCESVRGFRLSPKSGSCKDKAGESFQRGARGGNERYWKAHSARSWLAVLVRGRGRSCVRGAIHWRELLFRQDMLLAPQPLAARLRACKAQQKTFRAKCRAGAFLMRCLTRIRRRPVQFIDCRNHAPHG